MMFLNVFFKIMRYFPRFFFPTKIVETYSSGEWRAASMTPTSRRSLTSDLSMSFSVGSNWISGLGHGWVGLPISRWQCCTISRIFWPALIPIHAGTKCLSLPANICYVKLTCMEVELCRSSSSPSASSWCGGRRGLWKFFDCLLLELWMAPYLFFSCQKVCHWLLFDEWWELVLVREPVGLVGIIQGELGLWWFSSRLDHKQWWKAW